MMLFIFGGLPGTGKSELASELAREVGALYLRIDTIEQALRDEGHALRGPEGYVIAYRVALENLRLGQHVVADSVNPIAITREAWREVGRSAGVPYYEIEVVCSDEEEHRRRVESRRATVPGLALPTWQAVVEREYEAWEGDVIVIDTAGQTPAESKATLARALRAAGAPIAADGD